jgi:hypothetical protein
MAPVYQAMLVALSIGCTSEEGKVPLGARNDAPPRSAVPGPAPTKELVATTIDVVGLVATDLEDPVSGRAIVLVDARGERHEAVTDGGGGFAFSNVAPPYDVAVAPTTSGAITAYFGLWRRDPYLELFERSGPTPVPQRQTLRVGVRASSCFASSCWLTALTTSPSGGGSAMTTFKNGDGVVVVDVEHGWRGAGVLPSERIELHVLVGDEDSSSFAYAWLGPVTAAPGDTVDVGIAAVASVPASDPISVGVHGGVGALVDWRWTTSVSLDLSGGPATPKGSFPFAIVPAASTTVRIPLIPGAKMRAGVSASHPRGDAQRGFYRSTEVWSGALSSPDDALLDVVVGPELTRPAVGGGLSRRGLGFEWTPSGTSALSTLTVVDTTRGVARFRALTSNQEVPLARLAMLGVPKLDLGDHMLDLSTSPLFGIDDATNPDVAVRHRRQDTAQPGVTTYLRVPFQVTP